MSTGVAPAGAQTVAQTGTGAITGTALQGVLLNSVDANLTVTGNGGATTIAGGTNGVEATTTGLGVITITDNAITGGTANAAGNGIFATDSGAAPGGGTRILINGTGNVTGGTAGTGVLTRIINAANTGDTTYTRTGNVTGGNGIIAATLGTGAITIAPGAGSSIAGTGIAGTGGFGIEALQLGTLGAVTVTTQAGDTVKASGGDGIFAFGPAAVSVTNGAALSRAVPGTAMFNGIEAYSTGGPVTITNTGNIGTAADRMGGAGLIAVALAGNVSPATVTLNGGNIFTTTTGVSSLSLGTGAALVNGTGAGTIDVAGTAGATAGGIVAQVANAASTADASITSNVSAISVNTSGATGSYSGLNAQTNGTGNVIVAPTNAALTVQVTGTAANGGSAIFAAQTGASGAVTVTTLAGQQFTTTVNGDGIDAVKTGTGAGNVVVTNGATVTGATNGIVATSASDGAGGTVSINGGGAVIGVTGTGAIASLTNAAATGTVTVGTLVPLGAVVGGTNGIVANNAGSGVVSIVTANNVTGGNSVGIAAQANTGAASITTSAGSTIKSTNGNALDARSIGGNVSIASAAAVSATNGNGLFGTTTGAGIVSLNGPGTVTTTAAGAGVFGLLTGAATGAINIGTAANFGAINAAGTGILASVTGAGSTAAINVTTSANVTGSSGIVTQAAAGATTVTVNAGKVTATAGNGIQTNATTGATLISLNGTSEITAPNGTGVSATSTTGAVTLNVASGAKIDPIIGTSLTTAGGVLTIANAGLISGTVTGAQLVATPGTFAVTNSGTITGTGTGSTGLALAGSGSTAAGAPILNNAGATISGVTNGFLMGSTGTVALTNNGVITGANSIAVTSGTLTTTNNGTLTGAVATSGGTSNVTNNATVTGSLNTTGGTLNFVNNGTFTGFATTSGGAANVVNTGVFANTGLAAVTSFSNAASGNVLLPIGTTLSATNYTSTGGTLTVGYNISSAGQLITTPGGTLPGSVTNIVLSPGVGAGFFFPTDIPVVTGAPNGTFTVAGAPVVAQNLSPFAIAGAQQVGGSGLVQQFFGQAAPGNYVLRDSVNAAAIGGIVGTVNGIVSSLNLLFTEPASAFITGPANPEPDTFSMGAWARTRNANFVTNSNSATSLFPSAVGAQTQTSTSRARSDIFGFQAGYDFGIYNLGGSGWNANFGLTTGFVNGKSSAPQATVGIEQPFLGVYGALSGAGFGFDFLVRKDFYNLAVSASQPGLISNGNISGDGVSGIVNAQYNYTFAESWFLRPSASFLFAKAFINPLLINVGASQQPIRFGRIESYTGRLGLRLGTAFLPTETMVISPYAEISAWREFAGNTSASLGLDAVNSAVATTTTNRLGTFYQAGFGAAVSSTTPGLSGFVRGDLRFGERIDGYAVNVGVRNQF